jgi:uncharacterized damage-inducible protein DinB
MSPSTQIDSLSQELRSSREYFERSTRVLQEADSNFRPQADMMSVAQQVMHSAVTIEWFIEGASRPEGFDLDFEKHAKALEGVTSLAKAREMLSAAYENALKFMASRTAEDLAAPLPAGPVMGGAPVSDIVGAIVEHTAHHRGALTVYSRLLGKVPVMPYMG